MKEVPKSYKYYLINFVWKFIESIKKLYDYLLILYENFNVFIREYLKPKVGFEPTTYSLRESCSTPELFWHHID